MKNTTINMAELLSQLQAEYPDREDLIETLVDQVIQVVQSRLILGVRKTIINALAINDLETLQTLVDGTVLIVATR